MTVRGGRKTPLYDLKTAQATEPVVYGPCVARANTTLRLDDPKKVYDFIVKLFRSLTAEDFSEVVLMPRANAQPLHGDVYGKVHGGYLWYIKVHVSAATLIMSCHEAEHDMTLANGKQRRRPR